MSAEATTVETKKEGATSGAEGGRGGRGGGRHHNNGGRGRGRFHKKTGEEGAAAKSGDVEDKTDVQRETTVEAGGEGGNQGRGRGGRGRGGRGRGRGNNNSTETEGEAKTTTESGEAKKSEGEGEKKAEGDGEGKEGGNNGGRGFGGRGGRGYYQQNNNYGRYNNYGYNNNNYGRYNNYNNYNNNGGRGRGWVNYNNKNKEEGEGDGDDEKKEKKEEGGDEATGEGEGDKETKKTHSQGNYVNRGGNFQGRGGRGLGRFGFISVGRGRGFFQNTSYNNQGKVLNAVTTGKSTLPVTTSSDQQQRKMYNNKPVHQKSTPAATPEPTTATVSTGISTTTAGEVNYLLPQPVNPYYPSLSTAAIVGFHLPPSAIVSAVDPSTIPTAPAPPTLSVPPPPPANTTTASPKKTTTNNTGSIANKNVTGNKKVSGTHATIGALKTASPTEKTSSHYNKLPITRPPGSDSTTTKTTITTASGNQSYLHPVNIDKYNSALTTYQFLQSPGFTKLQQGTAQGSPHKRLQYVLVTWNIRKNNYDKLHHPSLKDLTIQSYNESEMTAALYPYVDNVFYSLNNSVIRFEFSDVAHHIDIQAFAKFLHARLVTEYLYKVEDHPYSDSPAANADACSGDEIVVYYASLHGEPGSFTFLL